MMTHPTIPTPATVNSWVQEDALCRARRASEEETCAKNLEASYLAWEARTTYLARPFNPAKL